MHLDAYTWNGQDAIAARHEHMNDVGLGTWYVEQLVDGFAAQRGAARSQQLLAGRDALLRDEQIGKHRTTMPEMRPLRSGRPQPAALHSCQRLPSL